MLLLFGITFQLAEPPLLSYRLSTTYHRRAELEGGFARPAVRGHVPFPSIVTI